MLCVMNVLKFVFRQEGISTGRPRILKCYRRSRVGGCCEGKVGLCCTEGDVKEPGMLYSEELNGLQTVEFSLIT
jgi:hypothetical protein